MKSQQLATLRTLSLCFLLPGLAGLILSAGVSTYYLQVLPRTPVPPDLRMYPRNIHGTIVYQTEEEDRRLTLLEDGSVGVFLVGLVSGLVYFRKWGIASALGAEDPELASSEID